MKIIFVVSALAFAVGCAKPVDADTARAAAMADMDLAAGTGSQAAINNARELLRACEASNG